MSDILYLPFISYLDIVTDAHTRMIDFINCGQDEDGPFIQTSQGQATIAVVFSAIAIESFINNYAVRKLGSEYMKKHIDRLTPHTKWIVVPKLATGRQIPSDHHGIELLQKLFTARNLIVHLKCANVDFQRWSEKANSIRTDNFLILQSAVSCFECIGLLGQALCECDPDETVGQLFAQCLSLPKYQLERHDSTNIRQTLVKKEKVSE